MQYSFTAVYIDGEEGWVVAYLEEFPGVHGQGRTIDLARKSLHEALGLALGSNRQISRDAFADARVLLRERFVHGGR